MYSPLSPAFLRRIKDSGRRKTVADVYYDGNLVAADLAVSDGSVRVELDGQVRRSGSIVIPDRRLVPTLTSTLTPQGSEVLIRHGVVYSDGSEELIPIGLFRLDVTAWGEGVDVPSIQLYDRSKALQVDMPAGLSRAGKMASAVIIEFLEFHYPSLVPISSGSLLAPGVVDYRLPGGHSFEAATYWDAISDLASAMGGRVFFDVTGQPRVTPVVPLGSLTPSVWEISTGEAGTLVAADRSYSREGVYNAVAVVGAAQEGGTAPSYTAYNNDPASPLRYGGPFGRVLQRIEDTSITTLSGCVRRANTELSRYIGLSYSLDFTSIPNPALEVGDFVRFDFASGPEVHEIAQLNIPLGKGTFTGASRGGYYVG